MGQLVNINTPNLLNGVSQQAQQLRRTTQASEQINASSDLLFGLQKRQGTEFVKHLTNITPTTAFHGFVTDRNGLEQHYITISSDGISITDLLNPEAVVAVHNKAGLPVSTQDLAYLQCSDYKTQLNSSVVEDFIFITNKEKKVEMSLDKTTKLSPSSLVFCKQVSNGAVYWVDLWTSATGTGVANYSGTFTAGSSTLQNGVIVGLISSLTSAGAGSVFTMTHNNSSVMRVRKTDGSDFRIEVRQTMGESLYAFKDTATSVNLLPFEGYTGTKIRITPQGGTGSTGYWVEFKPADNVTTGFTTGYWEESIDSGMKYKLNPSTMPHALISMGNNVFQFRALDWNDRLVGDSESTKDLSIIGKPINNVFLWKSRLGLLTADTICLSEISEYFNMFRTTLISMLDADPIDLSLASQDVFELNWFVSNFNQTLVFSNRAQFSLGPNNDVVTSKTIDSAIVSKYSMLANCKPCVLGNSIYFGTANGAFSNVNEMYMVQGGIAANNLITEQCQRYIEGSLLKIEALTSSSSLVGLTEQETDTLYFYKAHDQSGQRIQSCWSKIQIDGTIRDMFTLGSIIYIVSSREGIINLEKIDTVAEDVLLDMKVTNTDCTVTYNPTLEQTLVTVPYNVSEQTPLTLVVGDQAYESISFISHNTVGFSGDLSTALFTAGLRYKMMYDVSDVKIHSDPSGQSSAGRYNGRLQLRYLNIEVIDTQGLTVVVSPFNRAPKVIEGKPYVLGTGHTLLGTRGREGSDRIRIPILSNSRDVKVSIQNNSVLQCSIIGLNWEATVNIRGSSI